MSEAKKIALEWLKENEKKLVDIHQEIWELAEVGLQELKTAKKLTDILEEKGFKVENKLDAERLFDQKTGKRL